MCDLMPASQPAEKMGKMKKLRRTLSESFRSIAFKKEDSSFDEFPVDPDGTWCIWCVMYSCVELSETSLRVSRHHRTALACQVRHQTRFALCSLLSNVNVLSVFFIARPAYCVSKNQSLASAKIDFIEAGCFSWKRSS
ncbi:hypothetical protein XENORESO_004177 [Xenotaenia resolanae]|uniref:Uncharacterized protein n=1 Tax=Xenotaenia resolanae TaxID=208358 RepID=A0ABV0X0S1_9TELE